MSKEQQPIDKLFARKLEGLEGTPSAQAWNRLESRLGQKKTRKKGMIWLSYAAAAAVVLLLGALWVISARETPGPNPGIAVREGGKQNPALRTMPPANDETARPAPSDPGSLAQTPAPEPKQEREIPAPEALPTPEKAERLATAAPSRDRKPVVKSISEGQPVRRPEAPAPLPSSEERMAHSTVQPVPVDQLPTPEEQTLVVVVQLPAESAAPKAAFAEEALADEEEPAEPEATPRTRTGRLLEGLKKAKRGEFRELGLTPDHLLARFREKADGDSKD